MRTQRRKRAIAKTPRKKDGERWQSCLAPGQFPAEDGQILLPGLCLPLCERGGGGGRGGGACLLSWDLEWVGTFLWIPFGLSTLTSEVSDFLPGAFLSFPPSPPPLFHLSITIWVLLLGTQPTRCRHAWQCCTGT